MAIVAREERIMAQKGDVIGFHSAENATAALVPYESSDMTPLCCGLSSEDLSRIFNDVRQDNQLPVGTVLNVVISETKRLPALKPILEGKVPECSVYA